MYRQVDESDTDFSEVYSLPVVPKGAEDGQSELSAFTRVYLIKTWLHGLKGLSAGLGTLQSGYNLQSQDALQSGIGVDASRSDKATNFNSMLQQYNDLQQQTMLENMETQRAQAFWNPISSMSKRDATS